VNALKIEIYGTGCAKCNNLTALIRMIAKGMGVSAEVAQITDMTEILNAGIMMTPALVINGDTKSLGRVPSPDEIKAWILEENR
jgi:small redox-active disulfide protein 2